MAVTTMAQPQRSLRSRKLALGLAAAVLIELVVGVVSLNVGRSWMEANPGQLSSPLEGIVSRVAPVQEHQLQASSASNGTVWLSATPLKREQMIGRLRFAGPNHYFVVTSVVLRNDGSGVLDVDASAFSLTDAEGRSYQIDNGGMGALPGTLKSGTLSPRKFDQGYLVFHVPSSADGLTLHFQTDGSPAIRVSPR